MNTEKENVVWQVEEVEWGEFVPYEIIMAAADLSMQRAADAMTWPGAYPPKQSDLRGTLPDDSVFVGNGHWKKWDFVPDGLLVWKAWLELLEKIKLSENPNNPVS
jgi:hypothetical protein